MPEHEKGRKNKKAQESGRRDKYFPSSNLWKIADVEKVGSQGIPMPVRLTDTTGEVSLHFHTLNVVTAIALMFLQRTQKVVSDQPLALKPTAARSGFHTPLRQ
jgi:hypothetical protein